MEQTAEYLALPYYEKEYARALLAELNEVQSIPELLFKISCVEIDNDMVDEGRRLALNFYMAQHVTF